MTTAIHEKGRKDLPRKTPKAVQVEVAAPGVLSAAEPAHAAMDCAEVFLASPTFRIGIIKNGLFARDVVAMASALGRSQTQVVETLGLAVSTFNRKLANRQVLSRDESERVLGLAKLVGQVQVMVEQSGDVRGFNANHWFANWIDTPVPALGGHRPCEYLDTAEGRDLVSGLLAKMQSGAYA